MDSTVEKLNPIVLICTHERKEITLSNLATLALQSKVPRVVLVCSHKEEVEFYSMTTKGSKQIKVDILMYPNEPLGAKWQAGVNYAKQFKPNPLIITGSDDILSKHFVHDASRLIKNHNFVGLMHWYIYDPNTTNLYLFKYKAVMPLGGGRCYSHELLQQMNYELFDQKKNKHLDNQGWHKARFASGYLPEMNDGYDILAVKGDWKTLNPLEKTFGHKNAQLISQCNGQKAKDIMKQKFNYEA